MGHQCFREGTRDFLRVFGGDNESRRAAICPIRRLITCIFNLPSFFIKKKSTTGFDMKVLKGLPIFLSDGKMADLAKLPCDGEKEEMLRRAIEASEEPALVRG